MGAPKLLASTVSYAARTGTAMSSSHASAATHHRSPGSRPSVVPFARCATFAGEYQLQRLVLVVVSEFPHKVHAAGSHRYVYPLCVVCLQGGQPLLESASPA